jgi:hypothetical protein
MFCIVYCFRVEETILVLYRMFCFRVASLNLKVAGFFYRASAFLDFL